MSKKPLLLLLFIIILGVVGVSLMGKKKVSTPVVKDPSEEQPQVVEQLPKDKIPVVSLSFSSDARYVTINLDKLAAAQLEYNLIYDATIKRNRIQTGVAGSAKVENLSVYSNKQLLGSESSGHFTYHENIANAVFEITLRNSSGYSIYSATYPFEIKAGKTITLQAQ